MSTATIAAPAKSWVMLFPQGVYKTERHGTLRFTAATLAEIKAGFDENVRGIDIAVDVDHRAPNANDTRAAGWLKRVELGERIGKQSGLWGEVEWTPYGLSEVQSRQYRYISSEYQPGAWTNEITGATAKNVLFGLTLTNRPVMKNMPAIQLGSADGGAGRVEVYMGLAGLDERELADDEAETLADAELDDGGDSEEYAEDPEDAADGGADDEEEGDLPAAKAKAKGAGKGVKRMGEGSLTLSEQRQLVERVRQLERKDYEHSVATILGGWEAGTQQFSEQRAAAKAKPNGEAAKPVAGGRPVKVALSRVAMQAAKTLLLSEDFAELGEDLRGQIARVIELAATGAVDLSVRGGNSDTERVKTTRLSVVKPQGDASATAAFEAAWVENAVALAEAGGDDYEALVGLSKQNTRQGREAAAKVEEYQTRAHRQMLAGA